MTKYKKLYIGLTYGPHDAPIQRSQKEMEWHRDHIAFMLERSDLFPDRGRPELVAISISPTGMLEIGLEGAEKHLQIADAFCRGYSMALWRGQQGLTQFPA